MRGGITNHRLIACSLSNTSAKDDQNRLICIEVIVCYINVVFLRHNGYQKTLNKIVVQSKVDQP